MADFIDIEAALRSWFIDGGITAPISTRKPKGDKAVAWLQVVRIGGPIATLVTETPQVEVSAWADTSVGAMELLNQARRLLLPAARTADAPFIHATEYGGPVDLPDPTLPEQSRYTANWTLWTRI